MTTGVRIATPADRAAILDTLVAAFRTDPLVRWLFPDDATYPSCAAAFFGRLFDRRVGRETIWTVDGVAVAMWAPPSRPDDLPAPSDDPVRGAMPPDAAARLHTYEEVLDSAVPAQPYWYLGVLGTDPAHTGRGLGRAVMDAGLRRAATDGLPAVLETSNPRNVAFYRSAGWEVVGELERPVATWIMRQHPVAAD